MKLCPIAIVVGCQKCPIFKICPLKGVIGDQAKVAAPEPVATKVATKAAGKPAAPKKKSPAKPVVGRKPAARKK